MIKHFVNTDTGIYIAKRAIQTNFKLCDFLLHACIVNGRYLEDIRSKFKSTLCSGSSAHFKPIKLFQQDSGFEMIAYFISMVQLSILPLCIMKIYFFFKIQMHVL